MRIAVVKLGLLLSAFSPLLIAIALLESIGSKNHWLLLWVLAAAAPLAFLLVVLRAARQLSPRKLKPRATSREDDQILAFTASYVLPLAALFLGPHDSGWIAAAVLVLLLVIVYTRGDLVHLNPVLTAIGYRLYAVQQENGVEVMLLSRASYVKQKETIENVVLLSDHVYLQLEEK